MSRPKHKPDRLSIKQTVALLSDTQFRADVEDLRIATGDGDDGISAVEDAEKEQREKRAAFLLKWSGVVPPASVLS
jgi:hypothetical protein